ncbi:unnamed protein product, partial [marine sediment metagenome]
LSCGGLTGVVARLESVGDEHECFAGGVSKVGPVTDATYTSGAVAFGEGATDVLSVWDDLVVEDTVGEAPTVVYPNSTDCNGYESVDSERPPDTLLGDVVDSALSGPNLLKISTNDENYHAANTVGENESPGHRLLFDLGTGVVTDADVLVKGYGDGSDGTGWYLYVWDNPGTQWVFKTSHTSGSKDTLTANDLQAYAYLSAANYRLQIRLCGKDQEMGGEAVLYYAQCEYAAEEAPEEPEGQPVDVASAGSVESPTVAVVHVATPVNVTS